MSLKFTCSDEIIHQAVDKLKNSGRVSFDASFNSSAAEGLRKEVSYRDMDFLEYLGYCNEKTIVDDALRFLKENGLASQNSGYDQTAFIHHRVDVKRKFEADWGTITPAMERLFYMLSSVRQPKRILAIGIFWGNAMIWNIGSSCGKGKVYDAERVFGIDINPEAIEKAQRNINTLEGTEHISLFVDDGIKYALETAHTFDYVYLDVGISQIEKSLNFDILKNLYEKLEPGAWVLTHDTTHPFFRKEFEKYLEFVHNKSLFEASVCFDVDQYGLELSVKKH